jgi:nucleoside-diphosphate-sugar epimerase
MPASGKPFFSRQTVWWTTRNVNIVSTEKITTKLGYRPDITIDEGCRKTAAWFAARKATGT